MCNVHTLCQVFGEWDNYTIEHSKKVACLMADFAEFVKLSGEEVTLAYLIGYVHDIGKVGVPDNILNKPGRLTEDEFAVIKKHPDIGASLLAQVDGMEKVAEIVRHHHERFDGQGYGQGLLGKKIPFFSRMLSVCDAFDAMTSARCYRPEPLSISNAIAEVVNCAGTQFDPEICTWFADFIQSKTSEGDILPACI